MMYSPWFIFIYIVKLVEENILPLRSKKKKNISEVFTRCGQYNTLLLFLFNVFQNSGED